MADYPDGTYPVDIVAQTLSTMAVDIAAQTLATLGVNIKAQDLANLKVDVAAQTLSELGVNITAQDLSELVIKIAAQTVGVYLQPEWAAKEGVDKNITVWENNVAAGSGTTGYYTVPSGKTLFICGASFKIHAYLAADRDLNQMGALRLRDNTAGIELCFLGGNGGAGTTFPKPLVFNEGTELYYGAYNYSDHSCNLCLTVWGYEI